MDLRLASIDTYIHPGGRIYRPDADVKSSSYISVRTIATASGDEILSCSCELHLKDHKHHVTFNGEDDVGEIAYWMTMSSATLRDSVRAAALKTGAVIFDLLSIPDDISPVAKGQQVIDRFISGVSAYLLTCDLLLSPPHRSLFPFVIHPPFEKVSGGTIFNQNVFQSLAFPLRFMCNSAADIDPCMLHLLSDTLEFIHIWGRHFEIGVAADMSRVHLTTISSYANCVTSVLTKKTNAALGEIWLAGRKASKPRGKKRTTQEEKSSMLDERLVRLERAVKKMMEEKESDRVSGTATSTVISVEEQLNQLGRAVNKRMEDLEKKLADVAAKVDRLLSAMYVH